MPGKKVPRSPPRDAEPSWLFAIAAFANVTLPDIISALMLSINVLAEASCKGSLLATFLNIWEALAESAIIFFCTNFANT